MVFYVCYRNGTTYEPEGSVDVSSFIDGTQSKEKEVELLNYFASDATGTSVTR